MDQRAKVSALEKMLREQQHVTREHMLAANYVGGGWWVGLSREGGRARVTIVQPSERHAAVPWALPGGIQEYDLDEATRILAKYWTPLAQRWLAENRTRPFGREELHEQPDGPDTP